MAQMLEKPASVGGAGSEDDITLQDTASGPRGALGKSGPDQGKVWRSGPRVAARESQRSPGTRAPSELLHPAPALCCLGLSGGMADARKQAGG